MEKQRCSPNWQKINQLLCLCIVGVSIFFTGCGKKQEKLENSIESQSLGSAQSALLTESKYDQLVIEIASVSGLEPSTEQLDQLKGFLERYLNKSKGIYIARGATIPGSGNSSLDINSLERLEKQHRGFYSSGKTLTVFVMFLDGHLTTDTQDQQTYGLAFGATSIAVFKGPLNRYVAPNSKKIVEQTVMQHEFGHLMGLVNSVRNGVDQSSHKHCLNGSCLMFGTVYSAASPRAAVPSLDSDCLNDLRNAGSK